MSHTAIAFGHSRWPERQRVGNRLLPVSRRPRPVAARERRAREARFKPTSFVNSSQQQAAARATKQSNGRGWPPTETSVRRWRWCRTGTRSLGQRAAPRVRSAGLAASAPRSICETVFDVMRVFDLWAARPTSDRPADGCCARRSVTRNWTGWSPLRSGKKAWPGSAKPACRSRMIVPRRPDARSCAALRHCGGRY